MISNNKDKDYSSHLKEISFLGKIYKRYISSLILFFCVRKYGDKMLEIGSGIGSGMLGSYPKKVTGLDINNQCVEYCLENGLEAKLINEDGSYPIPSETYNVCILDNVLEHIKNPIRTLEECHRVTKTGGALIIVVPGRKGYAADSDHKIFYEEDDLYSLHNMWKPVSCFSMPFVIKSDRLSKFMSQYCLVAVYNKVA